MEDNLSQEFNTAQQSEDVREITENLHTVLSWHCMDAATSSVRTAQEETVCKRTPSEDERLGKSMSLM